MNNADCKILIVDDDEFNIKVLKKLLDKFYKNVEVAKDGNECLDKLEKNVPDLIILDIVMPGLNGYEVCEKIKSNKKHKYIKIVLVSANDDLKDRLYGYEKGADDYLTKPYYKEELLAKVKVLLKLSNVEKSLNKLNNYFLEEVIKKTNQLKEQSLTNRITNLPNSKCLEINLKQKKDVILYRLNIDSFNNINYAYGINVGNSVLKKVGENLLEIISDREELYHYSADEFVIISENTNKKYKKFANFINDSINNKRIEYQGINFNIKFSIGVVDNKDELMLEKSHLALLEARKLGRGRFFKYFEKPKWADKYKENIFWSVELKKSLLEGTIIPYFQPILNNKTNKIEKYECLVRIIKDNKLVSPGKFIEPAKQSGLLHNITKRMIEQCFYYFKDKEYSFSINLSNEDFIDDSIIEIVKFNLEKTGINADRVIFEVLENINTTNNKQVTELISELKEIGFKIAIDDFGTEYSNFASIFEIKADFIKIDGSFIKKLDSSLEAFKITRSITEFAHSIGCKVIAEFVSKEAIQEKVIELNIEYSQGYFISEPVPIEKVK